MLCHSDTHQKQTQWYSKHNCQHPPLLHRIWAEWPYRTVCLTPLVITLVLLDVVSTLTRDDVLGCGILNQCCLSRKNTNCFLLSLLVKLEHCWLTPSLFRCTWTRHILNQHVIQAFVDERELFFCTPTLAHSLVEWDLWIVFVTCSVSLTPVT